MKKIHIRPIKFRAWNRKEKKLRVVDSIDFGSKTVSVLPTKKDEEEYVKMGRSSSVSGGRRTVWYFKDIELVQLTGLKDCQKKDIYEGDLVRSVAYRDCKRYFTGNPVPIRWKTIPAYNGYNVASGKLKKIVGNVFENPELLKEKNEM